MTADADIAVVVSGDRLYRAAARRHPVSPRLPVLELISGVWHADPLQAFTHLRHRIFCSSEATPAERAAVRVAAQRLTDGATLPPVPDRAVQQVGGRPVAEVPVPAGCAEVDLLREPEGLRDWAAAATALTPAQAAAPRWSRPRAVLAVLLDGAGRPLLAARNAAHIDRTAHAEVQLMRAWWDRHRSALPVGSQVWVSLQPCKMCAALVVRCGQGRVPVHYDTPDPGKLAQHTALEQAGLLHWWPAGADGAVP